MKWCLALLLLAGCVTPPRVKSEPKPVVVVPSVEDPQREVRAVVSAFVAATEAKRFDQVLLLLARPLRDRYSATSLERDFRADPFASARVSQLKLKVSERFIEAKDSASLEWSTGRSLRLVLEAGGWRIAALE